MIYLDTSAIVKLVVAERESAPLIDWLNNHHDDRWVTSTIGHVELIRAAIRFSAAAAAAARRLAAMIDTLVLTDPIADLAATLAPPELRTLDAIHLATAYIHRRSLTAFCAYDQRLLSSAQALQLPVVAPG